MLLWANLTLQHTSKTCSPFSSQLITSNFPSILIDFHHFFTGIALDYVDLFFSLILVTKANAAEGEALSATWLYHLCTQSIHMTDGGASNFTFCQPQTQDKSGHWSCKPQHIKPKIIVYCLRPITFNQKLSHKFKTWYKFSNRVQAKSHKNKTRPACTENFETKSYTTLLWSWDYNITEIIKIEFVCWHKLNETSSYSRQLSLLWHHGLNSYSNTRVLANIITLLPVLRTITVTIHLRSTGYMNISETQMARHQCQFQKFKTQ